MNNNSVFEIVDLAGRCNGVTFSELLESETISYGWRFAAKNEGGKAEIHDIDLTDGVSGVPLPLNVGQLFKFAKTLPIERVLWEKRLRPWLRKALCGSFETESCKDVIPDMPSSVLNVVGETIKNLEVSQKNNAEFKHALEHLRFVVLKSTSDGTIHWWLHVIKDRGPGRLLRMPQSCEGKLMKETVEFALS